jgi:hypothetical protein
MSARSLLLFACGRLPTTASPELENGVEGDTDEVLLASSPKRFSAVDGKATAEDISLPAGNVSSNAPYILIGEGEMAARETAGGDPAANAKLCDTSTAKAATMRSRFRLLS